VLRLSEANALLQAAKAGDAQMVVKQILLGASLNERAPDGRAALHFCAIYDDTATAKVLIENGADIDAKDNYNRTPFRLALAAEAMEVSALLLSKGCELGNFIGILFDIGQHGVKVPGFSNVAKALRERLDDAAEGPLLLHEAIERKNDGAMHLLLEAGFDPNVRDSYGTLASQPAGRLN
jgi:ankyrin repeat protein